MSIFQERLRELRVSNKINQTVLAELLNVSQRQISKYEQGKDFPPLPALIALANFFDVSIDYLVGRTDVPEVTKK